MSIFRQLAERPWLTPQYLSGDVEPVETISPPKAKIGLWVFLAVVTMLFFLLIVAYAGRMAFEDWRPGPELRLLWLNTVVLLACSIAMQWAAVSARRGHGADAWSGFVAGGLLGVAFLLGQLIAWLQLSGMGAFGVAIPSVAFFYLITGLHALHIAGGLVAMSLTGAKWARGTNLATIRPTLELTTVYWHYLFGVWVVLFGLLFSGNNLGAALAFCGIK